jgi:hypothetical protein
MPTSLETPNSPATAVVAELKMDEPKAAVSVTNARETATGSLVDDISTKNNHSTHVPTTHFFLKGQF